MDSDPFIAPDASVVQSRIGACSKIFRRADVRGSTLGERVSIGDDTVVIDSELDGPAQINRRNYIHQSTLGRFTYTGTNTVIRKAQIGAFGSISWNVSIGGKDHDYRKATNSSLFNFLCMDGRRPSGAQEYDGGSTPCRIGNDVWIAANAIVLRNVRIGNGAVIGAGAVVTRDVEPYAVVVGVPGRMVKKRFDDQTIAALEEIKWWDWPVEAIRANAELLFSFRIDAGVLEKMRILAGSF